MRLLVDNVWPDIRQIAASGRPRVAVTGYFTSEKSLPFGEGDVLIVDASDELIKTGGTSARAIDRVCAKGADVYSLAGLHAKLLMLGSNVIVGSANLTENSEKLTEAAVLSDDPKLRAEATSWIERLKKRATVVDQSFVKRILALPVTRVPLTAGSRTKLSLLQAVRANDPLLVDFVFRAYSEDTDLSNATVKRAVKSEGEALPTKWTFFEDDWGPAEKKSVNKFASRYLITFQGTGEEGDELQSFDKLDPDALGFLYHIKIGDSLISLFDEGKPCPFRLTSSDDKELCDLMNAGLQTSPKLRARISQAPLWDFTAETLRDLVIAGESSANQSSEPRVT